MTESKPFGREMKRLKLKLAIMEQFPEEWKHINHLEQRSSLFLFALFIPLLLRMAELVDVTAYLIMLGIFGLPSLYFLVIIKREQNKLRRLVRK